MTRKICVADAEYGQFRRRVDELVRRVDEGTLEMIPVMDGVQALIEGRFGAAASGNFRYDKQKDGWTLLENAPRRISGSVAGIPFHKDGEDRVNGEEMVRRARVELDANCGQEDAEWLKKNQDKIPAELRKFILVFTATVWRSPDGCRCVPCLDWRGDGWYLFFRWLGGDFARFYRLAAPGK